MCSKGNCGACSLGDGCTLPPFTTFFMGTSSPARLGVSSGDAPAGTVGVVPAGFPVDGDVARPRPSGRDARVRLPGARGFHFFVGSNRLRLRGVPRTKCVGIFGVVKRYVFRGEVQRNSLMIPFAGLSKVCVLRVRSTGCRGCCGIILPWVRREQGMGILCSHASRSTFALWFDVV